MQDAITIAFRSRYGIVTLIEIRETLDLKTGDLIVIDVLGTAKSIAKSECRMLCREPHEFGHIRRWLSAPRPMSDDMCQGFGSI